MATTGDSPARHTPVWTVVVAGGGGTRFGEPKQFVEIAGRRVLDWSVQAARSVSDGIVVVVPDRDVADPTDGADIVVAGGPTRSASVRSGLDVVPDDASIVCIHDAARPAAEPELFARVVDAVRNGADGAVPGVAVTDSLRRRGGGAIDRDELVAVQTPQAFEAAILRTAHAAAAEATDDATLVEAVGGIIEIVEGQVTNTKLTHAGDRAGLEQTLAARRSRDEGARR